MSEAEGPTAGPGPGSELPALPPQPCTLQAIGSAIPSGIIGWVFGFVPSVVSNRKFSAWKTWTSDAGASGKNLMVFSGVYGLVHCVLTRMRQHDDWINRGVAGCATGLAVGWSGGPQAAGQSCLGIGLLSSVIDLGSLGGEAPANAAAAKPGCCSVSFGLVPHQRRRVNWLQGDEEGNMHGRMVGGAMHGISLPPVMWLGALSQGATQGYFEDGLLSV